MSENGVQGFLRFAGRASEHSPGPEHQRLACSPCAVPWLEPWDPPSVLELGQERCERGGMGRARDLLEYVGEACTPDLPAIKEQPAATALPGSWRRDGGIGLRAEVVALEAGTPCGFRARLCYLSASGPRG